MTRMRRRGLIALTAVLLLTVAGAPPPGSVDSLPDALAEDAVIGGRKYYLCMLGQALKIGGLVLVRPDVVLVGAIVGGLACGFGW